LHVREAKSAFFQCSLWGLLMLF